MNIPIANVNDFGTKDTQPYNYIQAEKRTQFKFSDTVLWALTGSVNTGDLAINIANQISKIQKFDNHVKVATIEQSGQSGGNSLFNEVQQSDNLIQKMQALNNKIRENMVMPM